MKDEMYVAKRSGSVVVDGERFDFIAGVTRVRESHPIRNVVPDAFDPVVAHRSEVEAATAAPGEKRE